MTQDEIIEMARQAGLIAPSAILQEGRTHDRAIEAFAELVAEKAREEFGLSAVGILERTVARAVAKEREACAKVCEQMDDEDEGPDAWDWNSKDYAKAIRARGNT